MFFKRRAIFDICGFADFSLLQTKPFVAVICKSVLCRIGWNGLSIHQCGFIFRNLFLRFTVCFSVAKAIFDLSGKLVSFDIACLPSTIFPMENIFSFCHFNYLRYMFSPANGCTYIVTDICNRFLTAYLTALTSPKWPNLTRIGT